MKNEKIHEDFLIEIQSLYSEMRKINLRLTSMESWLAAISTGKNLSKSHAFAQNLGNLAERITPTLEIETEI
jgi:hypothetical protein